MYKSAFYVLLFLLFPYVSFSQDCGCLENFDHLVRKITENYPGFEDKVTSKTVVHYRYYTDSLRQQAVVAGARECLVLLKTWLSFFKDKHLILRLSADTADAAYIRGLFADEPCVPVDAAALEARFRQEPLRADLEGIWESTEGMFRVALLQAPGGRYEGVVLRADSIFWLPGQIKFELTAVGASGYKVLYRNREHDAEESYLAAPPGTDLLRFSNTEWRKVLPLSPAGKLAEAAEQEVIAFRILNPLTTYLRLNSFGIIYKAVIDSLIRRHMADITERPNLIVDLRNNRGGYSIAFESLLPIIYTGAIAAPRAKILATPDNTALYEELIADPRIPAKNKTMLASLITSMKAHPGEYVVADEEVFRSDTVYTYPAKVALLINERSVSAAEDLVMRARQSKKVKIFGRNSAGSFDYFNLVGPRTMPCKHYIYYCPTSKGMWVPAHPIDNIGLPPDIHISEPTDWLSYINTYFQHQKSWRN